LTFQKYLVLAGITVFSTVGDSLLARGMKDLGGISLHHPSGLLLAILNPWVTAGILSLLTFFACYMSCPPLHSLMCSSPWSVTFACMKKSHQPAGWALL
jgi:hypothetical protein